MKKTTTPEHTPGPHRVPGPIAELVRRFVRGGTVLACDRHAPTVHSFAERLMSDGDCDEATLLELDASLQCVECSLIARVLLGDLPEERKEHKSTVQTLLERRAAQTTSAASHVTSAAEKERPPQPVHLMKRSGSLTVEPICLPDGPFCPTPVRLAAARKWTAINFGKETLLPFSAPKLPEPIIRGGQFPLVVTSPFRAQLEYAKGNDWHVALPLAPQNTRISVHINSKLYDADRREGFSDLALARRLGGCVIAVADKTSSYASRLILAARQGGITEEFLSMGELRKARIDPRKLYLLEAGYSEMVDLLVEGRIDGFSTVEPFPTLAKFRLGGRWAEATMCDSCTSASSGFCCVVMVPADLVNHPEAYTALLEALIRSICNLLRPGAPERLTKIFEGILQRIPQFTPITVATEAAKSTLMHFTSHLQDHSNRPDQYADLLVPDVTIEAIRAEASALTPHLKPGEQKRVVRGLERLADPKSNLFNFTRAREIFLRLIRETDFESELLKLSATLQDTEP